MTDRPRVELVLYIAGRHGFAARAVGRLDAIHEACPGLDIRTEIVDVELVPERAEQDRIVATPTLSRRTPAPRRRVVGDLADIDEVLLGLGLPARTNTKED